MCLFAALLPVDIPAAGNGECCPGAIMDGPRHCECWEAVYDQEQSADLQAGVLPMPAVPPRMCPDCAYRPWSPERRGDPRQACSEPGELERLVHEGEMFYCHQGTRRVIRLVHPSGAVYEPDGDYRPAEGRNSAAGGNRVPYKADGSPADICSGWFLLRQAWLDYCEREAG
jgi:hypothetical protein